MFELNDVFAVMNAIPAIVLLAYGVFYKGLLPGICFGAVSLCHNFIPFQYSTTLEIYFLSVVPKWHFVSEPLIVYYIVSLLLVLVTNLLLPKKHPASSHRMKHVYSFMIFDCDIRAWDSRYWESVTYLSITALSINVFQ